MPGTKTKVTVQDHFTRRAPHVHESYRAILEAARAFGPVREEAKKTSIHLVRRSAFAGIATRKDVLILTVKSGADIASARITKREQVSAHRWHLEIRVGRPADVDRQLVKWLKAAYEMSN
jgi:uncharacterized protein DUF5655